MSHQGAQHEEDPNHAIEKIQRRINYVHYLNHSNLILSEHTFNEYRFSSHFTLISFIYNVNLIVGIYWP